MFQNPNFIIKDFEKHNEDLQNMLSDIQDDLCNAIFAYDQNCMDLIERLLISNISFSIFISKRKKLFINSILDMLGHSQITIRDRAVSCLNVLYDGVDWQLRKSFKPRIACVGDSFRIDYVIEADEEDSNIILLVNGHSFSQESNQTVVSWHKPSITEYKSPNQNPDAK